MTTIEIIKKICGIYIDNPNCVYKLCMKKWLIVMEKMSNVVTNECRDNIFDANHAKFRANELKVLFIINVNDFSDKPESIINTFCKYYNDVNKIDTHYKVNEIVTCDSFDMNFNKICSNGIHYFKTIETAFTYDRPFPHNYNDSFDKLSQSVHWPHWYDDGQQRQ